MCLLLDFVASVDTGHSVVVTRTTRIFTYDISSVLLTKNPLYACMMHRRCFHSWLQSAVVDDQTVWATARCKVMRSEWKITLFANLNRSCDSMSGDHYKLKGIEKWTQPPIKMRTPKGTESCSRYYSAKTSVRGTRTVHCTGKVAKIQHFKNCQVIPLHHYMNSY